MKIPRKVPRNKNLVDSLIASAWDTASKVDYDIPKTQDEISPSGSSFYIETLLPIGVTTGDSRKFKVNSITARDFPLPLLWQEKTDAGHVGSVVIGRIDSMDITPEGAKNARGVFDVNPYAREAERMIRNRFLRGVSADLDKFSATEEAHENLASDSQPKKKVIKNKEIVIDEARIMGVTVVAMPAFQEATIQIDEPCDGSNHVRDGVYDNGVLEEDNMDSLLASAAPLNPPREWFRKYNTTTPQPISVDDDGRVYGYLALWKSDHIGYSAGQKPPRSSCDYKYFRSGVVRTDDGTDVTVGNLTLVGGHAPMSASAHEAVKHYDDTSSAVADVVAGDDEFGIWVAGALRPTVTKEQIRAMRASGISGDWRPINGKLELVAACFVNVPGFPTTRAMVSSGHVTALIASGYSRSDVADNDLSTLNNVLKSDDLEKKAEEAFAIMYEDDLKSKADEAFSIIYGDDISSAIAMMDDN